MWVAQVVNFHPHNRKTAGFLSRLDFLYHRDDTFVLNQVPDVVIQNYLQDQVTRLFIQQLLDANTKEKTIYPIHVRKQW